MFLTYHEQDRNTCLVLGIVEAEVLSEGRQLSEGNSISVEVVEPVH